MPVGRTPMRRMTDVQYANTIRDLFAGRIAPSDRFPVTEREPERYTNRPEANIVSLLGAERIMMAAEDVAMQIIDDLPAIVPCADQADEACARSTVQDYGQRAFRRPLRDAEEAALMDIYTASVGEHGFAIAMGSVFSAMLQMPEFLYFAETGDAEADDGLVRLTDYELATRLSYLIWDTMPDDELIAAAADGSLSNDDELAAQARRLLEDPRAANTLVRFHGEWLNLGSMFASDKDSDAFPEFDDELIDGMHEEFARFVAAQAWGPDASFSEFMTTRTVSINSALADLYGVDSNSSGPDDWQATQLDPDQRSGVLTMPLLMSEHAGVAATSPIFRGKLVRTQFLCNELPSPPPDAMSMLPEYPPGATQREKSDILLGVPACGGCHQLMDPIGVGFEHYNAIGGWQSIDIDDSSIDATGEVQSPPPGMDGAFDGIPDLAARLADNPTVHRCFARQVHRFARGLAEEHGEDVCVAEEVLEQAGSSFSAADLLFHLSTSPGFRFNRVD
ncbi:MAG: DUF1592 domain-containing protein [Myxococcales bacterium FL481]|nr:MAG: DUF1592 domain-containing protein [Myxococcales bacterium FL481]